LRFAKTLQGGGGQYRENFDQERAVAISLGETEVKVYEKRGKMVHAGKEKIFTGSKTLLFLGGEDPGLVTSGRKKYY